jgi:hypothetical protein
MSEEEKKQKFGNYFNSSEEIIQKNKQILGKSGLNNFMTGKSLNKTK